MKIQGPGQLASNWNLCLNLGVRRRVWAVGFRDSDLGVRI